MSALGLGATGPGGKILRTPVASILGRKKGFEVSEASQGRGLGPLWGALKVARGSKREGAPQKKGPPIGGVITRRGLLGGGRQFTGVLDVTQQRRFCTRGKEPYMPPQEKFWKEGDGSN